jgi:hypothetical protein
MLHESVQPFSPRSIKLPAVFSIGFQDGYQQLQLIQQVFRSSISVIIISIRTEKTRRDYIKVSLVVDTKQVILGYKITKKQAT